MGAPTETFGPLGGGPEASISPLLVPSRSPLNCLSDVIRGNTDSLAGAILISKLPLACIVFAFPASGFCGRAADTQTQTAPITIMISLSLHIFTMPPVVAVEYV